MYEDETDLLVKNIFTIIQAQTMIFNSPIDEKYSEDASLNLIKFLDVTSPLLTIDGANWVNAVYAPREN